MVLSAQFEVRGRLTRASVGDAKGMRAMDADEQQPANPWLMGIGVILLIAFGLSLLTSLINLWPAIERGTGSTAASAGATSTVRLFFGLLTVTLSASTALLMLVVIVGALGSLIHAATSFAEYAGTRRFYSSWIVWYLVRPVVGASLALLLYFAIRGGFFSGSSQTSSVDPYGMAALAGLAGLFSKQATDKLREVFETLFHVSEKTGDEQRETNAAAHEGQQTPAGPTPAGTPPAGAAPPGTIPAPGEQDTTTVVNSV
jgi:hypothetical protein